mmetsp:Transcript_5520/g.20746  ORF Transcript_5520/g.20746 Transcript_5520/m.20746 type:complete len:643 (-) Transcript_5520:78-2006(-)
MQRVATKLQREELKKGPRRYGMPRPKPFAMYVAHRNRILHRRYKKKWALKIENWWRDLVPKDLQPEMRRMGKGLSVAGEEMDERIKVRMNGIAGLNGLSENWYAELASKVGYSLDLMYYVYRRKPGDFEGFGKYFLIRSLNLACIEDVAELGELYQFMEKNFYHEMRSHHFAVRVHTAWLNVVSRHALLAPHKFYGGFDAPFAQLGLNLDGTLANGLVDNEYHVVDGVGTAQILSRVANAVRTLNVKVSHTDIMQSQHGDTPRSSKIDQDELDAFLLLARYVSTFEQKLKSLGNPETRTSVPYFSTYLLVKKAYEQHRPQFQWHPICAARSTDFVQKELPVAGDPVRIFKHYFTNTESQRKNEKQLLTPSSYTYEGVLRALLASGRYNKFVEFSRYYQDPEIHSLALKKMYNTQDWLLAQRFIVRNYKCNIDDLTRKQNALEPSVEDLGYMIAIFSKNIKRKGALVLSKQLLDRVESHPHEVVGCKAPFADAKDYTKVHDRQLFAAILKAERAIKNKQAELGVKVGFGADIEVDSEVVRSLRAVSSQHENLSAVDPNNRMYLRDWTPSHPSLTLTPLQRKRKTNRMKRRVVKLAQRKTSFDGPDPYNNLFRSMTRAEFEDYTKHQGSVFNAHRQHTRLAEAL